jgi:hypothetical protein
MSRKSGNRFSDKDMRKQRMIPKSVQRFSEKIMPRSNPPACLAFVLVDAEPL